MKCSDIINVLEALAPSSYACEWDNVGLLAGCGNRDVKKIYIALDATDEVIQEAVNWGADMLLTHHPLILKPIYSVNDEDFISRRILKLIECGISYYAMHTNFDAAPGCMADMAAIRLRLSDCNVLKVTGEADGTAFGVGKVGSWSQGKTLKEITQLVKTAFALPYVTVYGDTESQEKITKAAVSPGSGKHMIQYGLAEDAQVLITGDIGHHDGIDSLARGMAVIDAGHYGLEYMFVGFMEGFLEEKFGTELLIKTAKQSFPSVVL